MDSIVQLARFLGHRGNVSIRRDLFGQTSAPPAGQLSLKHFVIMTKGEAARIRVMLTVSNFTYGTSDFWIAVFETIGRAIDTVKDIDFSNIPILDEFSVEYPNASVGGLIQLFSDLFHKRIVMGGKFTLDIPGAVPWPIPDPDLVFTWAAEVKLIDSDSAIKFSCRICFDHVEGTGLPLVLGILGFLFGGPSGAAIGFGAGQVIDFVYERTVDDTVVKKFADAYAENNGVITNGNPQITIARPDDSADNWCYILSMKVEFVESAFKGLFLAD
jgi:hypothetical protein